VESDGLLEQAIRYALRSVAAVTPELLGRPTPCRAWDLGMLLYHSCDSLSALREAVTSGRVARRPADDVAHDADPARRFTSTARALLDAQDRRPRTWVLVGAYPLPLSVVAATGALEIAVHGWDVAQACGQVDPIPQALAGRLLTLAPDLVTDADRWSEPGISSTAPLFGPTVPVRPDATASDRLTAFLGRTDMCG
jgi:uncharacterized protein (TIGR03086 family)